MNKIFLLLLASVVCHQAFSQELSGVVIDNITMKPVPGANVFFNGSTIGTRTDGNGSFRLNLHENQRLPVAITSIGYIAVQVDDYNPEIPLKILLAPKIYELGEVRIYSRLTPKERRARERYLDLFREQFLGRSAYGKKCEILNENDLVFQYSEDREKITAYANNPLIIDNSAFGYQITYYLEKFEYTLKPYSLVYLGNYIFREDKSLNKNERSRVEKKRSLAYLGSRMHFFRALWENSLDSSGFVVKNESRVRLTYDSLVVRINEQTSFLSYPGPVYVTYFSTSAITELELLINNVFFDKLGYFDPLGIRWNGEMIRQRMGDQLPFDYRPIKDRNMK